MKTLNLIFASALSSAGIFMYVPSAQAGYSCSSFGGSTYCSGSINGVSVNSSSSSFGGSTYTTGSIGGEPFSQSCSSFGGSTYCN